VETGRVIQRRYLLQRAIEQGQGCIVYLGFDQVLQRTVAVKAPSAEHIPAYRAAVRTTSSFTHPNIIGTYDLIIVEPERLYVVQEYADGENFQALLQAQLPANQVVDLGIQVCHALLYASGSSRKACHGDLTPSAIIRDSRSSVRVNDFALPSDMNYFASWQLLGGEGNVVSDQQLPWGQLSAGRRADDTRALGILMYQLLASYSPGIQLGTPPSDGRLHFQRSAPPEVCEIIARSVLRQHPQYIATPEELLAELRKLAESLDPLPEASVMISASSLQQTEEPLIQPVSSIPSGKLVASLPGPGSAYDVVQQPAGLLTAYQGEQQGAGSPFSAMPPSPPPLVNMSPGLSAPSLGAYRGEMSRKSGSSVNFPLLFLLGLVFFVLFFVLGFLLAHNGTLPFPL
jgi:serine/threonine protein kinase